MPLHRQLPRAIVGAVIVAVVLACAAVQFASDALYARVAPASLVTNVPASFGLAVYAVLDRVAPADYVEDALGNNALLRGDLVLAQHYALRMSTGPRRDDLLAKIASARGQSQLAFEYAFAAADFDALQSEIFAIWNGDHPRAYALELHVRDRLAALGTHPDAVADAEYRLGSYASWMKRQDVAYGHMQAALRIAPFNLNYVLSAANIAYLMRKDDDAATLYRRALGIDPAAGDAVAGLGLVALRQGDRTTARADLARAQAMPDHGGMTALLKRSLQ